MTRNSYAALVARLVAGTGINAGKNLLKRATGRNAWHGDQHRFVARHLRHLLSGKPFTRLTVRDFHQREGAGSRALMTMFTIGFCRRYGLEYRHTPFSGLNHAVGDQRAWDEGWERFFNLGEGELPSSEVEGESFDLFELTFMEGPGGRDLTQYLHPPVPSERAQYYTDIRRIADEELRAAQRELFVETIRAQLPEFRARYRRNKPLAGQQPFTIAVHIRRGDVGPDRQDMWTGLDSFARTLRTVTAQLEQRGVAYRLLVFSQGKDADFAALHDHAPDLRLDTDPFDALAQLAAADVLVMSKSCFSYVAALLGEPVAIFEDCDFPAFPGWIMRDEAGALDEAALSGQLDARLARKV